MKLIRETLFAAAGCLLLVGAVAAQETIEIDTTVAGSLAETDTTLETGEFVDEYIINGEVGQTLSIRLNSDDFDAFLMYRDGDGNQLDNDDIEGTNSGLDLVLSSAAPHGLGVSTYGSGETGDYTLTVSAGPNLSNGGPISIGDKVYGELADDDEQSEFKTHTDIYTISLEVGQVPSIRLNSQEFDSFLRVIDPAGALTENDDYADDTHSGLDYQVSTAGEHRVVVSSFAPGITGVYTLEIR